MGTFYPRHEDPTEDIIDVVEVIMRRGLPRYGIRSPEWKRGEPCPPGHWCLPDGTMLYRYDVPDSLEGPSVSIGMEANAARRYVDSPKYWDVPCLILILWANDIPARVWRTIKTRLEGVFSNGVFDESGAVVKPKTYLSLGGAAVGYLKEFQMEVLKDQDGRPGINIRFVVAATARRLILSTTGELLTTPDGFTLTH